MAEGGGAVTENGPPISYPLNVRYCGECTMPLEYCEYSGRLDKCKAWLETNLPDVFKELYVVDPEKGDGPVDEGESKKKSKRGGKGKTPKPPGPVAPAESGRITLQRSTRGKNKSVTVVKGLKTFGIDLKVASKTFAQKFACGSSVTADDEIVVQGDVKDDLFDIITAKWKQVDEDSIEDLGDVKR